MGQPATLSEAFHSPKKPWYYSIELEPGTFTPGADHPNVILTRAMLSKCGIEGRDVLDVGTMEGLIPILAVRRGARSVVAVDLGDQSDKIKLVQSALDVDFSYLPNLDQSAVIRSLHDRRPQGFDVVVYSGVLYHVADVLTSLALVSSLVSINGVLIFESAVALSPEYATYFNWHGDGYGYDEPSNFWFVSVPLLDHLFRMVGLVPVECCHLEPHTAGITILRFGVACRKVQAPVPKPDEHLMPRMVQRLNRVLGLPQRGEQVDRVAFGGVTTDHPESPLDLYGALSSNRPLGIDLSKIRLGLGDRV